MRPWRKLRREFLSSSRIRGVSDAAYRLWTMLISAQDDDGAFAWADEAQLSMLVAGTTQWTIDDRERLAIELEDAGLITRENGFLFLYRGEEFNGHLRKSNKPFYYRTPEQREATGHWRDSADDQRSLTGNQRSTTGNQQFPDGALEEKKRGNEISTTTRDVSETVAVLTALRNAHKRDFGRVAPPGLSKVLAKFADSHPDLKTEWIDLAFEEASKANAPSWNYARACLTAWLKQGHTGKPEKEKRRAKTTVRPSATKESKRSARGFEPLEGPATRVG